jgi:uncharacterized damage-inducible protein DinB
MDAVEALALAPTVIVEAVEKLSPTAWEAHPVPGEWSVADIVGHIRAADAIWSARIYAVLVHDGVSMPDIDERRLQEAMQRGGLPFPDQVRAFTLGRTELCGALRAASGETWTHVVWHSERGPLTLEDACANVAGHEAEHLAQLRAAAKLVQ